MTSLARPALPEFTLETLAAFRLPGPVLTVERYGKGHINDTLLVCCAGARFIAQRLNHNVFPDGAAVMGNIAHVCAHLATRESDPGRRLSLVPTRDGGLWHADAAKRLWRIYPFIEGTVTLDQVSNRDQAYTAAATFARFLAQLSDCPGPALAIVIPGFHDTPGRCARLADAVARNASGRADEVAALARWALAQTRLADALEGPRRSGALPSVPTHNDTKINNILMSPDGRDGRCVIDLDTLMPGTVLYDLGDLFRTASCREAEDGDPARMVCDAELASAIESGWLDGRGSAVGAVERRLMRVAGAVITFECAVRFLTDHLDGDRYFRIHRPGHNLARATAQFALATSLAQRADPDILTGKLP